MNPNTLKEEIAWLFNECESLMGIHSNFNALILASKLGTQRTRIEDGELVSTVMEGFDNEDRIIDALDVRRAMSRMAATGKNRRIMACYARLHPAHQRILEAAFEARQLPPEVRKFFGDVAGVVPITQTATTTPRFSWDWLSLAIVRKDGRVPAMKREAERMFQDALAAYGRAKEYTPEPAPLPEPEPAPVSEEPAKRTMKRRAA